MTTIKAVIITNKDSEYQDSGSEINETGKVRQLCKILEKMIRLLNIPPQNIALIDVSDSAEQQFWVATQTGLAYPKYPLAFIGDELVGSLSEIEAIEQRIPSIVAKGQECSIRLAGMDKCNPCGPVSAITPFQELRVIRKWCTAKELSGLLSSADEEGAKPESTLAAKNDSDNSSPDESERDPTTLSSSAVAKKTIGINSSNRHRGIGSMLLASDEFTQVISNLPTVVLSQVVFTAIAQGRSDVIKKMVDSNTSLTDLSDDGWNPLEAACIRGSSLEIIDILVGLPYMTVRCYLLLQRICAICSDVYDAIVQKLFSAGKISLDAEIPDKKTGQTVFHLLCRAQNVSLLRIFAAHLKKDLTPEKAKAVLDTIDKKRGRAVLHTAALCGDGEMARLLLDAGASPDVVECTPRKRTPLHFACENSAPAVVESLLKAGANVNSLMGDGQTPLHVAVAVGFVPVIRALLEGATPVLDVKDKSGQTPLHVAAINGRAAAISCLSATGRPIGVDLENAVGHTALQIASKGGFCDVVEALLGAGASINLADVIGATPLYIAASEGFEDIVDALVAAGANIEAADKNGITPLYAAVLQGRTNVVGKLLSFHANAEVSDVMGTSPLSVAAQGGHEDIVRLLLKAGVNPNATDKEGWTSLRWACQQGHFNVVVQLIEGGADVSSTLSGAGAGTADLFTEFMAFICSFQTPYMVNALCSALCNRKKASFKPAAARLQTQSIDLSGRSITALPRMFHTLMPSVTEINLENNDLTYIPPEYAILKDMRFKGNPLDAMPKTSAWNWAKLRPVLQNVSVRAGAWWEFRAFVLGTPDAGKRTLLNCLNEHQTFKRYTSSKGVTEYHDYFVDFKGEKTNCVCNVFCISEDMATQKRVVSLLAQPHARGAAFIICCNVADPAKFSDVDELVRTVCIMSATAPIIIVLTHAGCCSPENAAARVEEFKTKYSPRAHVVRVDSKAGTGISDLRGLLLGPVGTKFGTRSTSIPGHWVMFYDFVQRNQGRISVGWDEFSDWAKQCGLSPEDNELEDAAKFLAAAGLIVYRDPTKRNDDSSNNNGSEDEEEKEVRHVVLSPSWLGTIASALASIRFEADAHATALTTLIEVDDNDSRVLSSPKFAGVNNGQIILPGPLVQDLSAVLEEFCLWHRITLGAKDYVFVPALLPAELTLLQYKKLSELWTPQIKYPVLERRRILKLDLFPDGLAEQLVVRVLRTKGAVPDIVWRRGVLFHTERETAFVTFNPEGRSCTCAVRFSAAFNVPPIDGVSTCNASTLLESVLAAITAHMRSVCPGMCGAGMQQIVVCSHCIQERPVHADPLGFGIAQCEASALLQCPLDRSVFVRSGYIAPDTQEAMVQISEDSIEDAVPVSVGCHGTIHRATYRLCGQASTVYIPNARLRSTHPAVLKDLATRVRTVCSISHPYIARVLGTIATRVPRVKLVYGHPELRSLRSFLLETSNNIEKRLYISEPLRLASEVAEGMKYLHKSVFPPLLHGGLSSYSVFVTPDKHVKIADVGIKDFFLPASSGVNGGGSEGWRWKAPDPPPALPSGDVYSFGILLWELVSPPALPYEEYALDHTLASLRTAIAEGLRPELPVGIPPHVREVIQACWDQTPSARPSFDAISAYLAYVVQELSGDCCAPPAQSLPSLRPTMKEFFSPVISTDSLLVGNNGDDDSNSSNSDGSSCDPPTTLLQSMKLRSQYKSLVGIDHSYVLMFAADGSFSVNDGRGYEQKRVSYVGNGEMVATSELPSCILVSRSDGTLTTYAKVSYLPIATAVMTAGVVTSLYSAGDSKYVWGGTRSGSLVLWDAAGFPGSVKEECVLTVHEKCVGKPVTAIVRHEQMVITAIGDSLYSFSVDTGKPLFVWPAHVGGITSVVSMPPNVWTGTSAGEVWMWNLPPELPGSQEEFNLNVKCTHNRVFCEPVNKMLGIPCSQQVWTVSKGRIVLWDAVTARPLQSLILPPSEMRNLFIVPFLMTDNDLDSTSGGGDAGAGAAADDSEKGKRGEKRQMCVLDAVVIGKTVWTLCEDNFAYIWKNPEVEK